MALSANTVFEVRTGGSDTVNSGGFVTGASGTDYSMQNAPQYTLSGLTTSGANAIILTASASVDMIGNLILVTGGTNFTTGTYQITAVSAGVSITVDRNVASGVGAAGTANIGGALASPGKATALATVSGMQIWIKAGTYTMTTSTPGAAGPLTGASAVNLKIEGYTTTRGDRGGRPIISAGAVTTITILTFSTSTGRQEMVHVALDGNSGSGVSGVLVSSNRHVLFDCTVSNCSAATQTGFSASAFTSITKCQTINCTTGFANTGGVTAYFSNCWAKGGGVGFTTNAATPYDSCLASGNTGDGFINTSTLNAIYVNCTSNNNGGDGFDVTAAITGCRLQSCVATNNAAWGFNTHASSLLENCASYNNTSGRTSSASSIDDQQVIVTVDPWTNAASDDYRPNATASGGALLRNAASGVIGQTNGRDIGAVQSIPSGGGSGAFTGIIGG